jgi:RNA polymerase sigma-70 factor (ECF subfamily)
LSGRFTDDSGQMGTTIKGSSEFSVNRGSRLENCTNNSSGFRNIDPRERVVPAIEKTPHQSENTLAGQRVDLDPNGVGVESPSSVLWREPISEGAPTKAVAADRDTISSQAAEEDLIHRILSGHRELFMDLIRPHQRTVYATVFSLLAHKEDAEDVAQDTFVKALARLNQFRKESSFGTWLIQIAMNEARMRNRKQWRVPMISLTRNKHDHDKDARIPKDFEDWREIPSTVRERVEVREALVKALGSLAQQYREAFVLRDIHELSISETSATLGISPGAVKTRLRRARLKLRDMLAQRFGQDGGLGWVSKEVRKPWE